MTNECMQEALQYDHENKLGASIDYGGTPLTPGKRKKGLSRTLSGVDR